MKILYLGLGEFGSLPEHYHQVSHLRARGHLVSYIGFSSREDIVGEKDGVLHLRYSGPLRSRIRLFSTVRCFLQDCRPDAVVVPYFKGCSVFTLFIRSAILDIRTVSVHEWRPVRVVENILIRLESWLFSRGFVVSEELRRELRISDAFVLSPQGAQKPKEIVAKSWSRLRLLYVGTLHNRRLHEFVQGLAIYVSADGIGIIDEFIIIGHGSGSDRQRLVASIEAAGLSIVKFVGEIRHPNLQPFLDRGNVGVSYVPVTPYFNLQPVTKTSEYRLNGMAVLATNTVGNKKVIRDEDGVIHGDNPNAVAQALRELVRRRDLFKSSEIQQRALPECWEEIVSTVVEPAMLSFAKMKDHNS